MSSYLSLFFLHRVRLVGVLAVLGACVACKWYFAGANALQLDWLLGPTSAFVSFFSGLSFVSLDSEGYYNAAEGILIAPACSGLNFFIILLATGSCLVAFARALRAGRLFWFAGVAVAAYGMTLVVNTVRILLALVLYRENVAGTVVGAEQLHRVEGIVVYYVCLCLFAMIFSALLRKHRLAAGNEAAVQRETASETAEYTRLPHGVAALGRALLPLGCYLLFTLGVPLANGAAVKALPLFLEHSLTVLLISAGLSYGFYRLCRKRAEKAVQETTPHDETQNSYC